MAKVYNVTRLSTLVLMATGWAVDKPDYYTREWAMYDPADASVDSGYAVFDRAAREVARLASERDIQVVTVFVPTKKQLGLAVDGRRPATVKVGRPLVPGYAIGRMSAILQGAGVPVEQQIDVTEMFRGTRESGSTWQSHYFAEDAHLNEHGNARVAAYLGAELARRRLVPAAG